MPSAKKFAAKRRLLTYDRIPGIDCRSAARLRWLELDPVVRLTAWRDRRRDRDGRIEGLTISRPLEHREDLRARRVQVLSVLEHGDGAFVVVTTEQDLAEQCEPDTARPVDLDDAQELTLRLFPLMEGRVGACQQQSALEVIR